MENAKHPGRHHGRTRHQVYGHEKYFAKWKTPLLQPFFPKSVSRNITDTIEDQPLSEYHSSSSCQGKRIKMSEKSNGMNREGGIFNRAYAAEKRNRHVMNTLGAVCW